MRLLLSIKDTTISGGGGQSDFCNRYLVRSGSKVKKDPDCASLSYSSEKSLKNDVIGWRFPLNVIR